jgi:hypothetical protein
MASHSRLQDLLLELAAALKAANIDHDLIDIERLLGANGSKLDLDRVRSYFRLFDREKDLDRALGLVARKG